ncbi:unnamed protein product [Calypogeia fissa]
MASLRIPLAGAVWTQSKDSAIFCKCGGRGISGKSNVSFDPLPRRRVSGVNEQRRRGKLGQGSVSVSWRESVQSPAVDRRNSSVCSSSRKDVWSAAKAVAVKGPETAPAVEGEQKIEYDWRTEWYPLYLTDEVPKDAPLALNVYDHNLVLFYDGDGKLNCLEDQCPHRAAKLSDGQIMDGNLECLYHGWQFKGDGSCAKIPQLPAGAVIPKTACARSYAIRESQDVVWVWMADKTTADESKLPYFENYAREGFSHVSTIHEFPYDHSILVENVLDPAHIHIAHDRTDFSAKREKAEALSFEVTERNERGFAGYVKPASAEEPFLYRFQAPSIVRNDKIYQDKDGKIQCASACFLVRPTGQGKCTIIIRFGGTNLNTGMIPKWLIHMVGAKVFDQDVIFLAAQNETLIRNGVPTENVYLNIRSSDTMVVEYRKWLDKVGHGLPYYFGHKTVHSSPVAAAVERAPAGPEAHAVSTQPSKGAFGHMYARDPTNRYFKHVVHCKSCRSALNNFRQSQKVSLVLAVLSTAVAITLSSTKWRTILVALALVLGAVSCASSRGVDYMTQNFIRPKRQF